MLLYFKKILCTEISDLISDTIIKKKKTLELCRLERFVKCFQGLTIAKSRAEQRAMKASRDRYVAASRLFFLAPVQSSNSNKTPSNPSKKE